MTRERKLVKEFDKNGDGWLNAEERKAARVSAKEQEGGRRFGGPGRPGGGGGGFGPRRESQEPGKPGVKLAPADVKAYPGAPLYGPNVLRTLFLEFDNADWEKELADFKNTDVEVPAKLTVDGKTYPGVGVHFHGMSSFMMVEEGLKRSLVLSLDFINPDQELAGYSKLVLLNAHEDPSFLRSVLGLEIARDYLPAPKANFARVVINGESWGVYVNQQHFNKDFLRDFFKSPKGTRWKVPGSPNGRGGLDYLGDDVKAYTNIYELRSKDDSKSWIALMNLCRVLNQTPSNELENALSPILDIDGALRFFAWENVLANGDGVYTRASDYNLYLDATGRFHLIPYDANESFSPGGGPGGPGGPRGPGRFGPGMMLAPAMVLQADKDQDEKLTQAEFTALADSWFDKFDPEKSGKVNLEDFSSRLGDVLPPPPGGGPQGGRGQGGGRGGFGPGMFLGGPLFNAMDGNHDGSLTRAELKRAFTTWFDEWDKRKNGNLTAEDLSEGLTAMLPPPNLGGPGGMPGPGGGRRGGGPGMFGGGGTKLEPLVSASDESKPLISKLLAVPSLRTRYLNYVREMADKWLDWNRLGPVAQRYQDLIAEDVKVDTRKLDSYDAFQNSLGGAHAATNAPGGQRNSSLKSFADQRRAFLLKLGDAKQ